MKTVKLQLTGMHCTSCAMNIDGELEDTKGVKEAKTNYARQETEVTFDPEEISIEEVVAVIQKIEDTYQVQTLEEIQK